MGMRTATVLVSLALLSSCGSGGGGGGGGGGIGGLPAGLPAHFAFGLGNGPGGDDWMTVSGVPWDYRYQYLSGGVNTGGGWAGWNTPAGEFALICMNESRGAGIIPVEATSCRGRGGPGASRWPPRRRQTVRPSDPT